MKRLTSREKTLAVFLAVCLVLIGVYALLIEPARARIETLERVIPERREDLARLKQLSDKVQRLSDVHREAQSLILPEKNTVLISDLEKLLTAEELMEKASMKQQNRPLSDAVHETAISIEMKAVTLNELLGFLDKTSRLNSPLILKELTLDHRSYDDDRMNAITVIACLYRWQE